MLDRRADAAGRLSEPAIFWHLDSYPTRAEVEAGKGPRGSSTRARSLGGFRHQIGRPRDCAGSEMLLRGSRHPVRSKGDAWLTCLEMPSPTRS